MNKKNKKEKAINRENFRKFLRLKKSLFVLYFVILFYIGEFSLSFLKVSDMDIVVNYMIVFSFLVLVGSLLGAIILLRRKFHKCQQIKDSLCFKILEKCQEMEQYQRFLDIKECITTYEKTDGECDVETNIAVVEAAIEHDQAFAIVVPILITVLTAIFFEPGEISVLSLYGSYIAILMCLIVIELVKEITRNAFIKKVVEKVKEEQKLEKKKKKHEKRNY